jgi:hypothetical protein
VVKKIIRADAIQGSRKLEAEVLDMLRWRIIIDMEFVLQIQDN